MKLTFLPYSMLVAGLGLLSGGLPARAADSAPTDEKVLRVCQDPNNLPFSSRDLRGFENKIAAMFADQLGWKISYTWFPQRMGFIRNTLRGKEPDSDRFKCDLVTGVAQGFEMGATTAPYYHSTYAMAYLKGRGLDQVVLPEDLLKLEPALRKSLRMGVFAGSPVTDWMLQNGLMNQIVTYQAQSGDADQYPGQMVEQDLASGKIDVAFLWGPIAGYFAKQAKGGEIAVRPLHSRPGMLFDFRITMAVRHGDRELKQRIDQLIVKNHDQIQAMLVDYGVPLVDERGELMSALPPR